MLTSPPSLSAFQNKLNDIARDYETMHVRCLDLEMELLANRSFRGEAVQQKVLVVPQKIRPADASRRKLHTSHKSSGSPNADIKQHSLAFEQDALLQLIPEDPTEPLIAAEVNGANKDNGRPPEDQTVPLRNSLLQQNKENRSEERPTVSFGSLPKEVEKQAGLGLNHTGEKEVAKHVLQSWSVFFQHVLSPAPREWQIDPIWDRNRTKKSFFGSDGTQQMLKHAATHAKFVSETESQDQSWCCNLVSFCLPLHPNSPKKLLWDTVSFLLVLFDCIMLPMGVFDEGSGFEMMLDFKLSVASFWSADLLISFATGYYTKQGTVAMSFRRIARHYLGHNFIVDVSLVAMDWIFIGLTLSTAGSATVRFLLRGVRGLRLLRLRKGFQRMSLLSENICTEHIVVGLNIFKLLLSIFLGSHYIACLWYGLSRTEFSTLMAPTNWATSRLSISEQSGTIGYAYTTSLHWALTQFTPASMEVVPVNTAERAFACGVIVSALVVFSSFVSAITQAMNHLRQINNQKMLQESTMRRFLKQRNVAPDTSVQIWRFVKRHKLTESALVRDKDISVLQQLPSHLKIRLRQQMYTPHLVSHPLFFLLVNSNFEQKMMSYLCKHCLNEVHVGAGVEAIVPEQEMTDMVFVLRGTLEYVLSDDYTIYVNEKQWACELVLWANHVSLPESMMGGERGAEICLLNSTAFRKCARKHGSDFDFLSDYAVRFVKRFRLLSDARSYEDLDAIDDQPECVLVNDWNMIDALVGEAASTHPLYCLTFRKHHSVPVQMTVGQRAVSIMRASTVAR